MLTTMQRAKRFQDRSILSVDGGNIRNLKKMQENLSTMIDGQLLAGNELQFPSDSEINTAAILNKQQIDEKYFLIFDVRRNSYIRKV